MDEREAMRDAESARYRLQVRLGMIAKLAEDRGDQATIDEVSRLRSELRRIRVVPSEAQDGRAMRIIERLEPDVRALQIRVGFDEAGSGTVAKWARVVFISLPIVFAALALIVVFERRRRKKSVDALALSRLEAAERRHSDQDRARRIAADDL